MQLKEVSDDLAHRVRAIQELLRERDGRDLAMRLVRVGAASMVTHLLRQTPIASQSNSPKMHTQPS